MDCRDTFYILDSLFLILTNAQVFSCTDTDTYILVKRNVQRKSARCVCSREVTGKGEPTMGIPRGRKKAEEEVK
jgi:hypothetical protein